MLDLQRKKILVTGAHGFLGAHVMKKLKDRGVPEGNISVPTHHEADLRLWEDARRAVRGQEVVIHLAGKVGGIGFNQEKPAELFYDNIRMGIHLMEAARLAGVQKFVALGTICAYPKFTPVPFREEDLWSGYPEETNAPYGIAKKMLLVQSQAYRSQYGFPGIFLLPVNMYGPGDSFDPKKSHVIPALIRKVAEANESKKDRIEVWGTGKATREFLYVEDAAEGILRAAERYDGAEPVNLGSGREISIRDLVMIICKSMDFRGEVHWDDTKPDGQPRRLVDTARAQREFDFEAKTDFETGLRQTIDWWLAHAHDD